MLQLVGILLSLASTDRTAVDADLVRAIQRGDSAAFRLLFDRFHWALYSFVTRSGVPPEAAEDILQDVFTGVWTRRTDLEPSKSIRAYLYRACRNRSANYFRDRARLPDILSDDPVHTDPGPDDQAHLAQLRDHLSDAISRLPDRRRAVFQLCFVDGLSYKETAEVLQVTPKTVENQMGYALKSIRAHLNPFLDRDE